MISTLFLLIYFECSLAHSFSCTEIVEYMISMTYIVIETSDDINITLQIYDCFNSSIYSYETWAKLRLLTLIRVKQRTDYKKV